MPYMSLDLSAPTKSAAVKHKLSHDLESLFLVFLHIMRFLSSPRGDIEADNDGELKHQISRWHHEPSPNILFSDKRADLLDIFINPEGYITEYWRPVAPYLKELFTAVYPDISFIHQDYSSPITPSKFISILTGARDHCALLLENKINYAEILPPPSKKRPSSTLPSEKKVKKPRKAKVRQAARDDAQPVPQARKTQVGRFSAWEDSVLM